MKALTSLTGAERKARRKKEHRSGDEPGQLALENSVDLEPEQGLEEHHELIVELSVTPMATTKGRSRALRFCFGFWLIVLAALSLGVALDTSTTSTNMSSMHGSMSSMGSMGSVGAVTQKMNAMAVGTQYDHLGWPIMWTALGLALASLLLPWEKLSKSTINYIILGCILMLFPLQAGFLPWSAHHAIVVILPVIWLAWNASQRKLIAGCVLSVLAFQIPTIQGDHSFMQVVGHGIIYSITVIITAVAIWRLQDRTTRLRLDITKMAATDSLTGLLNRRAWNIALSREISRAERFGTSLSMAIIDVDDFKLYNDTRGHQAGDQLLITIAKAMRGHIRDIDVLSRWGGDEFATLLVGSDGRDMQAILDRIADALPDGVKFSAGISSWQPGWQAEEMLRTADTAMYAVKRKHHELTIDTQSTES